MTPDALRPNREVAADPHVQLRRTAHAMESMFLDQMFQAMRASVPSSGGQDDPARELFTGLLDQQIAGLTAGRDPQGLGEALYRQLVRRLDAAAPPTTEKGK
ncbi:MAG: hypothetical protein RL721_245 [Candidatus Eisenbacteria bacterium]|jgi:flagellar protein FlgJ